jgi:flagella basal body P-ring formation protein FlgA
VRERWLVERNARVVLQAQGAGFTISRDGKALDNGSLGSTVRVMGSDGKMLSAPWWARTSCCCAINF